MAKHDGALRWIRRLVRSALRYVRATAVLPINSDHEQFVDRLVDGRVVGTAVKRPLHVGSIGSFQRAKEDSRDD